MEGSPRPRARHTNELRGVRAGVKNVDYFGPVTVAVTNSLASFSDHLTAYDDPYYSNYGYQRQHLFQRQFATGPQFSWTCPTALSGLTSAHDARYSWARSDCKYLLLKQLRLQRQVRGYTGRWGGERD